MRPELLERQAETEEHTFYSEETHRAFTEAGFYRILQPRRFGGYEFDLETYFRVIIEIARGCPSTGWCLCLGGAHVLQVASMFDEQAQAAFFGPDGHFVCASYGAPVGVAEPRDDGYVIGGKFSYASGIPYSTHFMGQTLLHPEDPLDPGLMFVIPAEQFERLDDWHGVLGMRGSGSHSIQIDDAWIPASHAVRAFMVDLPVEGGTVGSRLHGNPMYAGRTLGFFHGEFGAIMVGSAYAALDEYQRIITTRPATWIPTMKRYELVDYQRYLGEAIAEIACAEAAVIQGAQQWMELARCNVEEDRPFTRRGRRAPGGPAGHRLPDRVARRRGHPLPHRRLGGRARRPAHAALLARHVDLLEPQHAGPARLPAHEPRAPAPRAADRAAGPGPGGELVSLAGEPVERGGVAAQHGRRGRRRRGPRAACRGCPRRARGGSRWRRRACRSRRASRPAAPACRGSAGSCAGAVAARTWRLTYSDGLSLTQGTSRQIAFQSLSKRHSSGGSHEKPASSRTTRSAGTRSKTPSETRLSSCAWATICELPR